MELSNLLQKFKQNTGLILGTAFTVAIIASLLAQNLYPHYVASVRLYIFKDTQEAPAGDYSYDGYYAQQFAEAYTDTVVGFLETTETIAQAVDATGNSQTELRSFVRAVDVEKTAPQLIVVQVSLKDEEMARDFVASISDIAIESIDSVNAEHDTEISVELVNENPLIEHRTIPFPLGGIVGFLIGLLLGTSIIVGQIYLKENE